MAQVEKSDQDLNPEFWQMYAADKRHCPDTWPRELGEWQFDGVDESGTTKSDSKCTQHGATKQPYLSPLHEELAKWLPAT
jgi:hypothetical protein